MDGYRKLLEIGLLAMAGLLLPTWLPAASGEEPAGIWMRGDGNAKVAMEPCDIDGVRKFCAVNLWIKDSSKGEAIGDKLIMTLSPTAGNEFSGEAYDPKRDRTYSILMTVNSNQMTTRGCVFLGLICKSVSWTRVGQ